MGEIFKPLQLDTKLHRLSKGQSGGGAPVDEADHRGEDKGKKINGNSNNRRKMKMFKFIQFSGMFLLLIFLHTCAWVAEKKQHGEECSNTEECNEREFLACQHGLCSCSPSHTMLYDEDLQRCVARVGEKCGAAVRIEGDFTVLCVDGAICDESSGGCVCTDDYFRIANGTCARKRKYLEPCRSDAECAKDFRNFRPLTCREGVCTCDPDYQFYDEIRKQCVARVGTECSAEVSHFRNECPENAICQDGKCVCEKNFAPSLEGKCALGHGEPCAGEGVCSDVQFFCLDGKCQCKFINHQHYSEKNKECLSLVAGPCTLNRTEEMLKPIPRIQRCTKNAICTDQGFYAACECMEGYVQRKNGECAPGYGETCEPHECDPITPLFCRNGKCDCQDELQYYDPSRKACLGLVGTRCNPQEINQCVQFASCIEYRIGITELQGKCLCDRYSQEVENRTCIFNEAK